jgi:hypothetical protein
VSGHTLEGRFVAPKVEAYRYFVNPFGSSGSPGGKYQEQNAFLE